MSTVPGGVYTALITPCRDDGSVDLDAVGTLIDFQVTTGVTGLFVLGTAGAGPLLDRDERREVGRAIIDAAGGRLFVIVHVGALPTSTAVALAQEAVQAGARAIAAVPPVYYGPDFRSVRRYYEHIAAAAPGIPLLAYNNPPSTGYDLRPEQAGGDHPARAAQPRRPAGAGPPGARGPRAGGPVGALPARDDARL